MHRKSLLTDLAIYGETWLERYKHRFAENPKTLSEFISFVQANPECFERSLNIGHVTGSALIATADLSQVLLTHHKKLNRWLQLGGHSDGHPVTSEVSLKEAQEESGLNSFQFFPLDSLFNLKSCARPLILDIDIHSIPARGAEPEHTHYDIRYLLIAQNPEKIVISDESHALRWFALNEAHGVTEERSMQRQFEKLGVIRNEALTLLC